MTIFWIVTYFKCVNFFFCLSIRLERKFELCALTYFEWLYKFRMNTDKNKIIKIESLFKKEFTFYINICFALTSTLSSTLSITFKDDGMKTWQPIKLLTLSKWNVTRLHADVIVIVITMLMVKCFDLQLDLKCLEWIDCSI